MTTEPMGITIACLVAAVGVLAGYASQEHGRAQRQRTRAEENWMWAELERTDAAILRKRLAQVERRHANLQAHYAELTRRLLANNYILIERHRHRKRS